MTDSTFEQIYYIYIYFNVFELVSQDTPPHLVHFDQRRPGKIEDFLSQDYLKVTQV